MSHVATCEVEIRDLSALRKACAELGVEFVEGKKTYNWYGRHVGDYPMPKGMTKEQLGKCDHVIRVKGVEYEVGVVKTGANKWTLAYDFWGPGQGLLQKFGPGCQKLTQSYAVHKATLEAQKKGLLVKRVNQKDGSVKLSISGKF